MNRRQFLMGAAAATTALGTAGVYAARRHFADAATILSERQPLPMPPVIDAVKSDNFTLSAQEGVHQFYPGVESPTLGFNEPYLGPVIRVAKDHEVRATVRNTLGEAVTAHWHGLLVPGNKDGGPHQPIAPGETWSPKLEIDQPAATLWYHTHIHKKTALQVYQGLAGVLIIDDGRDRDLGLPVEYGVDDLVLVLQDKVLTGSGQMVYRRTIPDIMHGLRGGAILVNGQLDPFVSVPKGIVRLRLVNAANARIFDLAFGDGRSFHLIASDQGLLPSFIEISRLRLSPGERAEILVDFGDGDNVSLWSEPDFNGRFGMGMRGMMESRMAGFFKGRFPVIAFRVDKSRTAAASAIPPSPNRSVDPSRRSSGRGRTLSLDIPMGPQMMAMMMGGGTAMGINGRPFHMQRIDFDVSNNTTEIWRIRSPQMGHPFHVHGARFKVLSHNGGPARPEDAGWKDTVFVEEETEILVEFKKPAPETAPFMVHCHILEHEDAGMMGQVTVS